MPSDARERLRARQGGLVRALVAGEPLPAGFDAAWAATSVGSLHRKRRRGVARAWPRLAKSLGPRFAQLFEAYVRDTAPASEGYHGTDGARFAHWLAMQGELPAEGRIELALWRLESSHLACDVARVNSPARLLVAVRIGPVRIARLLLVPSFLMGPSASKIHSTKDLHPSSQSQ